MSVELPEELAALVTRLYATQQLRSADEAGGVAISFITNNRLYRLMVQTEDTPEQFTLSVGAENPYMEAPGGLMQAFVQQMRARYPSANYGPRGPHGADFGATASGRRFPGLPLEAEFLRCKQTVDLCLDGTSAVLREVDPD
jgi:uncharacterized protein YwlG (UPF0340 family)